MGTYRARGMTAHSTISVDIIDTTLYEYVRTPPPGKCSYKSRSGGRSGAEPALVSDASETADKGGEN